MKRIYLSVVLIVAALLASFSRSHAQAAVADTGYVLRTLTFEEANLVSSYYQQDGDHASVTGGKGSEKLTDIANVFDVKFYKYSRPGKRHTFGLEAGIDQYSSASSDQVDLMANSSASSKDLRIYPSLSWMVEEETKGTSFGSTLSYSTEYDYQSLGAGFLFGRKTKDRNGEFVARLQAYMDQVLLIYPVELRPPGNGNHEDDSYSTTSRNSYSASLSWSQVISPRLQVMFLADVVYQNGYLGLPFHRVYFNDQSVHVENLPGNRLKIPVGLRANYFAGDRFIFRAYYRYYTDDWGLHGHTVNLETSVKINPFISLTPFYRYYDQSAVRAFAPYAMHSAADTYYTSNYDLSKFQSHFAGAGLRWMPLHGVLGLKHFAMLEVRYGYYSRNDGLLSQVISMHLKFH